MYYENKRSFYIKQYGPVALIIFVALVLIVTGVVIGINSMNKGNVVAEVPTKEETKAENNDLTLVDTNSYTITDTAITGKVVKVDGLTITVEANNTNYEINLIGIKENKKNPNLSETIKNDLLNKKVTVDFDSVKTENGKVYGYIYLDKALYNRTLLLKGLAELRTERNNVNKLDILVAAQKEARHNEVGIWTLN